MRGIGYSSGTYKAFLTVTYQTTPTASFTPSTAITDYPDRLVTFTDASTGGNLTYNWSFNNVSGNNTWVVFSKVQNPTTIFTEGNWTVNLTVANAVGSSTSSPMWINLSKCNGGTSCNLRKYPSNDADVQEETDSVWHTMRNASGDFIARNRTDYHKVNLYREGATATDVYSFNSRTGLTFDTSEIPDFAVLTNASLSLYVYQRNNLFGTTNLSVIDVVPWNKNSYLDGDYHNTTFTRYATDKPYSSITTSAYNNITIDNLTWISKTGYSSVMLAHSVDVDNGEFIWTDSYGFSGFNIRSKGYSGGTYSPIIEIKYSTASTVPDSIDGLTNTTINCTSLAFNWTNPTSNLGNIMLWRNNTALANVSNSTTGVVWTGLPEDTDITFSSKTCNLQGVCNATFVNMTTKTGTCDTTPPKSLGIAVGSKNCSAIDWSLTPPPDSDYAGFQVWWDNIRQSDQPNSTTSLVWTGLTELTSYTISTRTFDLKGNVNLSFANLTTDTTACGVVPVASFTSNRTIGCNVTDTAVQFNDTSSNIPTSWYWDFGDSTNSTDQNPMKTWITTGVFTVSMRATNSYGSDWENKTSYIKIGQQYCDAQTNRYVTCMPREACLVSKIW